ncbi:MAG: hypothetical protein L0K86_26500 [Actinomycetia bacterium]|nr:hypothetical protein [Actinomycetes bacterium]
MAELTATSSVELFVERIRTAQPGFALSDATAGRVAEICVALDGLPLALELAAARVRSYGLDEVRAGMASRLTLLRGPGRGIPARHRSLADAVRWSVELLSEPALRCFAEVSVFAGGWTADAARAVCGADVLPALAELVDQSLVVADLTGTGVRYRMLETLREYAAELLAERGDLADVRRRHLLWCTGLAEEGAAAFEHPGSNALDRADAEFGNLQVALELVRPGRGRHAVGDPAGVVLGHPWAARHRPGELRAVARDRWWGPGAARAGAGGVGPVRDEPGRLRHRSAGLRRECRAVHRGRRGRRRGVGTVSADDLRGHGGGPGPGAAVRGAGVGRRAGRPTARARAGALLDRAGPVVPR